MTKSINRPLRIFSALLVTTLMTGAASAGTVSVTITNEQAVGGLFLTPLWSVFHDGTFDTFSPGATASAGVELLAEEGAPTAVDAEVAAANAANGTNFQTAFATNPAGFAGAPVLDPGEVTTFEIELDAENRYFSFLSMVIPSNDTFIGNGNPLAYELFDMAGDFVFTDSIQVTTGNAYDAGTEVDDGNGAAFAPPTGTNATDTTDPIALLADLDFLIGRPQAPGGTVLSASGTLATITFAEIAPVPLPAGMPLLAVGLGAFALMRRKKRS